MSSNMCTKLEVAHRVDGDLLPLPDDLPDSAPTQVELDVTWQQVGNSERRVEGEGVGGEGVEVGGGIRRKVLPQHTHTKSV